MVYNILYILVRLCAHIPATYYSIRMARRRQAREPHHCDMCAVPFSGVCVRACVRFCRFSNVMQSREPGANVTYELASYKRGNPKHSASAYTYYTTHSQTHKNIEGPHPIQAIQILPTHVYNMCWRYTLWSGLSSVSWLPTLTNSLCSCACVC